MNRLSKMNEHINTNKYNDIKNKKIKSLEMKKNKLVKEKSSIEADINEINYLLHMINNDEYEISLYHEIINQYISEETNDWMKEFYNESPNWLHNNNTIKRKETINWIDYSDYEKKEILDFELNDIMNSN